MYWPEGRLAPKALLAGRFIRPDEGQANPYQPEGRLAPQALPAGRFTRPMKAYKVYYSISWEHHTLSICARTTYCLLFSLCLFLLLSTRCIAPAHADGSIRLVVWGLESGEETKGQDAKIAEFERRHPGIKVMALSMGAGAMNPQKLMTAIVGGVPPDVTRQDRFTVGDWASRGAFRALNDLLAEDARAGGPLAIRQADYVPATWAETQYQGSTFAIPMDTDDRVLYYNKDLFRKVGLDPNKPPQTWDQLIEDAKKLTVRTDGGGYDRIGFVPIYGQGWLYLWSWQEDGDFLSPDGRRCTLDNPATLKALTAMVSWYDALGGIDAVNTFSGGFAGQEQDPFMTGKLAIKIDGDGFVNAIARYHPELDFGVCPVPVPVERLNHEGIFKNDKTWVTWSGGFAWAIPRGSVHYREAWQFIQWMNCPEANLIAAQAQAAYVHEKGRLFVPGLMPITASTAGRI